MNDGDAVSLTSRNAEMGKKWEEIAQAKRDTLKLTIPNEWLIPENIKPPDNQLDVTRFPQESGWFSPKELEITSSSATDLLGKLATGEWSSEEVTSAFCKRASAAQQLVLWFLDILHTTILTLT
jgi:amidase